MVGRERERDRMDSSLFSLRSSSSYHLFVAFFTGGGTVGDGILAGSDCDAGWCGRVGLLSVRLSLNAFPATSWAAMVATALLPSRGNPSRCGRSGKAAEEAHLFIAGAIFNREADLDTQGDTPLV
jgi:hypothetical protein